MAGSIPALADVCMFGRSDPTFLGAGVDTDRVFCYIEDMSTNHIRTGNTIAFTTTNGRRQCVQVVSVNHGDNEATIQGNVTRVSNPTEKTGRTFTGTITDDHFIGVVLEGNADEMWAKVWA